MKKPLIVKQEPDNIIIGKDHGGTDSTSSGGAGATIRPSDSRATVILIISTFVAACSTFHWWQYCRYNYCYSNQ